MIYGLIFLLLTGCMFKDGHYISDNPVEEIGEAVLQAETGLDIDVTPFSPERPKIELIQH